MKRGVWRLGVGGVVVGGVVAGVVLGGAGGGAAVAPADEPDVRARVDFPLEPCLEPLRFLTGSWAGTYRGDPVEETWSRAEADSMAGMFRWQSNGEVTLFELITIKEEENEPVMRIRHFDGKMEPWKGECEGVPALRLADVGGDDGADRKALHRAVFRNESDVGGIDAVDYSVPVEGQLRVELRFKDPQREAIVFVLKRRGM